MAIYSKPVRFLMKDMAGAFELQPGQSFTKQQAIDWFAQNYPKIKIGTISAHLIRLSTNARTRLHYNAKQNEDDVFFKIDGSHFRLYDSSTDPTPIHPGIGTGAGGREIEEEPPEHEDATGDAKFAYESDLKNYLSKNLSVIEQGLSLYQEEGINGIEFPAGGRYIDILAVDANNDLVVIELKVSRGYDRVIGQLMRYMSWIATNQAEPDQKVRGIIVAREISQDLVMACSLLANVHLFEYELSLTVSRVETETEG